MKDQLSLHERLENGKTGAEPEPAGTGRGGEFGLYIGGEGMFMVILFDVLRFVRKVRNCGRQRNKQPGHER